MTKQTGLTRAACGLPEVKLGLLPAPPATQRLPRAVARYGFPPCRGGPMFHADTVGLDTVARRDLQRTLKRRVPRKR